MKFNKINIKDGEGFKPCDFTQEQLNTLKREYPCYSDRTLNKSTQLVIYNTKLLTLMSHSGKLKKCYTLKTVAALATSAKNYDQP